MPSEPIEEDTAREDDRPGLIRRAIAAIKGYPSGWVIDKKFTAERWAEGNVETFGDNAGPLAMAGMLPDRWVLVIHSADHKECSCTPEDYSVKHVEYFSVTEATYERFAVGDGVSEFDKIIDID